MIWKFAYVYEVARISLLSGEKRKYKVQSAAPVFLLTLKTRPCQNPNNQIVFSKPWADTLHGLSISKSPIKNHATLFRLGWIGLSN